MQRESRTVIATPAIRELVKRTVDNLGPTGAARRLGVSRGTLLAIMADVGVTPGSLALLREAYARSELARPSGRPEVA